MSHEVILASASPRRQELCQQLGLAVEVRPVDIDETPHPDEPALDFVCRMAREKALACSRQFYADAAELPILGSDTIVSISSACTASAGLPRILPVTSTMVSDPSIGSSATSA